MLAPLGMHGWEHTPSAQNKPVQSVFAVQAEPIARPPALPGWQSPVPVQVPVVCPLQ